MKAFDIGKRTLATASPAETFDTPGKRTLTQDLPPQPVPTQPAPTPAQVTSLSLATLAPMMMAVAESIRFSLYPRLPAHSLPARSWLPGSLVKPPDVSPIESAYLDEVFYWAVGANDAITACRCLEARYGLPSASSTSMTMAQLRDLYTRIPTLDDSALEALTNAALASSTQNAEQTSTPEVDVLRALELLRTNIGTAVKFAQTGIKPGHLASLGMRTIRLDLQLPEDRDAAATTGSSFLSFLDQVKTFNAGHPSQAIKIDLLLDPDMRAYGMGFAQITEQTVASEGGKEVATSKVLQFEQKALYLLGRKAANTTTTRADGKPMTIADIPELETLKTQVAAYVTTKFPSPKAATTALQQLEAKVIAAATKTAKDPKADAAALASQWNRTYAGVGKVFGDDCNTVRTALASYGSMIAEIEIGNEPQAQWETGHTLPIDKAGNAEETEQFIATTQAAMAELTGPKPAGQVVLEAPLEWDAASEAAELAQIMAGTSYVAALEASTFLVRVQKYLTLWVATNAKGAADPVVPLAIHAYNSPRFDQALITVLENLANGKYSNVHDRAKVDCDDLGPKVMIHLYVTEFQVDADTEKVAPTNANGTAKTPEAVTAQQTTGLVAAGTAIELAVAACKRLTLVSMIAWSYTEVDKGSHVYELDQDPSLKGLLGGS